jgi:hypothetical protein
MAGISRAASGSGVRTRLARGGASAVPEPMPRRIWAVTISGSGADFRRWSGLGQIPGAVLGSARFPGPSWFGQMPREFGRIPGILMEI